MSNTGLMLILSQTDHGRSLTPLFNNMLFNKLMDYTKEQTSIVSIRSQDRVAGGTSSSFTVQFNNSDRYFTGVTKVALLSAIIPNTIYNIRTGINDQVVWLTNGSVAKNYQIPAGFYSITQLLSNIQTGMNAADANTYVLSYSTTTYLVNVSGTLSFTLTFGSSTLSSTSCWRELGFTQVDTAKATSQTATNVFNLIQPYFLFIKIKELGTNVQSTVLGDFSTFTIPCDVNGFNVIDYRTEEYYDQCIYYSSPVTTSQLTIQLFLSNQEPANLNGSEWYMNLEVTHLIN